MPVLSSEHSTAPVSRSRYDRSRLLSNEIKKAKTAPAITSALSSSHPSIFSMPALPSFELLQILQQLALSLRFRYSYYTIQALRRGGRRGFFIGSGSGSGSGSVTCYLLPLCKKKFFYSPLLSSIYINIFIIFINNIKVTKVTEYPRALFFKG